MTRAVEEFDDYVSERSETRNYVLSRRRVEAEEWKRKLAELRHKQSLRRRSPGGL